MLSKHASTCRILICVGPLYTHTLIITPLYLYYQGKDLVACPMRSVLFRAGEAPRPFTKYHTPRAHQTLHLAPSLQASGRACHACTSRMPCPSAVCLAGSESCPPLVTFVPACKGFITPRYTLGQRLTGVWRWLGMLTQGGRWLILFLKTDLS